MAGKQSPSKAWILADGFDLASYKPKGSEIEDLSLMEKTHGLGDDAEADSPIGLRSLNFAVNGGFFDTASNSAHDALKTPASSPQGTPRVVCVGFAGQVLAEEFRGISGVFQLDYKVIANLTELTKANARYAVAGKVEPGQIIQPLATKTADWNTKALSTPVDHTLFTSQRVIPITSNSQANPTVITTPVPHGLTTGQKIFISGVAGSSPTINGERTATVISALTFSVAVDTSAGSAGTGGSFVLGSTVNGGAGYLQVKTSSGFTNFVAKLQDSDDDVTYADLITFADNVVAPFAERKTVAGTIDRWVAVDGNVTGTGSLQVFVGLSRF